MLKFLLNLIRSPKSFSVNRSSSDRFYIKNLLAMAGEGVKTKSDLNLEHLPVKKIKLNSDDDNVQTRTVATMCGAWRPDEVDGGIIFVFKTRDGGLSPDPTKESDYPENIEDFWEASLMNNDDIQRHLKTFLSSKSAPKLITSEPQLISVTSRLGKMLTASPKFKRIPRLRPLRWNADNFVRHFASFSKPKNSPLSCHNIFV